MKINKTLQHIANTYQSILSANLVGIYIHGSLAFGCFNPNKSDIDFIVVVDSSPTIHQKESLISLLLNLTAEAPPKGFEMSVVEAKVCKSFVYPTPFELHFSNVYLQRCKNNLREYCKTMHGTDKDLAAHFTIIKKVGYTLIGKPISEVFGNISKKYYFDSIKLDVENSVEDINKDPTYTILNLCRVYAYKKDELILSKEQGGAWGITNLPREYTLLIDKALKSYKSDTNENFNEEILLDFCDYMLKTIFEKC
jgi:predicted nucleotidyltransferase